jgi:hypothetical protein
LNLSSEKLVSNLAFKMQLAPYKKGQALNFDQAYSRLQQSLTLMGDPVPTPDSCAQAGIEVGPLYKLNIVYP